MSWKKIPVIRCQVITHSWNYGAELPHQCLNRAVWEDKDGHKVCWQHKYSIDNKKRTFKFMEREKDNENTKNHLEHRPADNGTPASTGPVCRRGLLKQECGYPEADRQRMGTEAGRGTD